jgi:hypothetical protein
MKNMFEPYTFLGKTRKVKSIRSIHCEIRGCSNPSTFQVQFEDGLWVDVCEEHKPKQVDN